ncbi:MAG: N-acetylmuramoyl-L-alanine amidase [Pseudomonadota bacterium]
MSLTDPSPNFGPRRGGARPWLIVLHYTAMESCEAARDRLCDPAAEVSSHYLIGADGAVLSLVEEEQRAWHAGAGAWGGCMDVNSASIGIELDNDGQGPFAEPLMQALERLLPGIMQRWGIPPEGVIGHSDMAYARKVDPGRFFDWQRLARAGLSVWPEAEVAGGGPADFATRETIARFGAALQRFGYAVDDPPSPLLLDAFRTRFRPDAGAFDARDIVLAEDLAARFPVDPGLGAP